jgi:3-methyladenine DNA glycosylase AlkD
MAEYPMPGGNLMFDVMRIISVLDKSKEPGYEKRLRLVVPSSQSAHAVRKPAIRAIAADWIESHADAPEAEITGLAEALWSTGWREERIVALSLIASDAGVVSGLDFDFLRRLALDVDNWELIDNVGRLGGRLLQMRPRLLPRVEAFVASDNPLLRRLAVVTLIEGADDLTWQGALTAMIERLKDDPDELVRKAVARARRFLRQRGAKVG